MIKSGAVLVCLLFFHFGAPSLADDLTVKTARPVVVRTVPEAGSTEVDPKLGEIKVTFSKDMKDGSWSWAGQSDDTYPKVDGTPKYLDKRTCTLPVKLEPGKTYAIWINSEKFQNFKDEDGRSAVPYLLVFQTKGTSPIKESKKEETGKADKKPVSVDSPVSEDVLARVFDDLWEDMDRNYSYFVLKEVDWKALKERYREKAVKAGTARKFVAVLKEWLGHLRDGHVWIEWPLGQVGTYRAPVRFNNYNRQATLATLDEKKECGRFAVIGKIKEDNIGAVILTRQSQADAASVRQVVDFILAMKEAPGFLLDLRDANGGNELLAQEIAQQFCGQETIYAKSKYRAGPGHADFGPTHDRHLQASEKPFLKPVVCLIGPRCVSSGEGFAQMMKCLPQITMVGNRTRGSSGNPKPFQLPGLEITVYYSRWVDLMPAGTPIEGIGISPDLELNFPADAYAEKDPTWEKALEVLRKKVAKEK
ncbi:MAG TPA: S41 family peptidase [Gemmataceae bacterium]|nr:S41 family peptidase [Gemmataceae bacterium]